MNILLVFEYPTLHGGERSLLTVIRALHDVNVHWQAIGPESGPLAEQLRAMQIPVTALPRFDGSGRQMQMRGFLAKAVAQIRPDLIHANSLAMARTVGPVAHDVGIPSVGHLRDILRLSATAITDLNSNSRLVAVSRAVRDHHVAQGLKRELVEVIYNGVDPTKFAPGPATGYLHQELRIPEDAILLGGIGQLGMRKGWDVLWQALPDVMRCHRDVHFLLVGEQSSQKVEADAYVASLRQVAALGDLAGRVHWLGRRGDIPALLRELTLLVHPARQEPLGRVLLEAAATGLPIVATDVGGTPEIFPADSQAARLVPPEDPTALVSEVMEVLGDEALRQQLSAAARCRIESTFRDLRCAKATWGLYQHVLAENHSVPET